MPGGAAGDPIRCDLRVQQRLGDSRQRPMRDEVDADRARVRDIHHAVLRVADDHHHRPLHTDRRQAETVQTVDGDGEEEEPAGWAKSLRHRQSEERRAEERHSDAG